MTETFIICIIGGYLLGSVPFGLVVTRLAGLGDIRKIGSGNIGATNVLRTGRKDLALLTVLLDASKAGFAGASLRAGRRHVFCRHLHLNQPGCRLIRRHRRHHRPQFPGLAEIQRRQRRGLHLRFHSGNQPGNCADGACHLVFAFLFRYSSLAALAAAVLTPLYAYFYAGEVESVFFTAVALLVVVRHHANIRRLIKGEESKISFGKKDKTTGNTKENGQDKAESAKK